MGTGQSGELPVSAVKKVLNVPDLFCIPDDPVATIMSINLGNPLVIERPSSKISQSITKLAESLIHYLEDVTRGSALRPATAVKAAAVIALNTLPFCK
jgi:MinD-like ATPase involved in chromosome partitioning or flagellar assembly